MDGEGVVVGSATVGRGPGVPVPEPMPVPASLPEFPGDTVWERSGHGPAVVKLIQQRLDEVGYGPITVDGDFGSTTTNVVRDFQSQNDDRNGEALDVDGRVGELTWGALFFEEVEKQIPDVSQLANLNKAFVEVCRSQIGVVEDKPFRNRGPRVDGFIRSTGIEPFAGDSPWCVAFLYWCGLKLCEQRGIDHPMPQTAGVHRMWKLGKKDDALAVVVPAEVGTDSVRPGMIFFMDTGRGRGHAGVVVEVEDEHIRTIEGNTNSGGSREGFGAFERRRQLKMESLMGYLDFWSRD